VHIVQTADSRVCGCRDSRWSCRNPRNRHCGRRPDFRLPAQRHAALHRTAGGTAIGGESNLILTPSAFDIGVAGNFTLQKPAAGWGCA
jgi:hypothetical protein